MKRLLGALGAAALVAVMTTGVALANHAIAGDTVAPKSNSHAYVAGNPKCGETPAGGFSLKIEADVLAVGNYGPIDITFYDGTYVSWAINAAYLDDYDANQVIVKGGPNAIIYQYSSAFPDLTNPAGDLADDSDTRLTSPQNPNGRGPKYYGISHVQFCFDPKA